MAPDIYAELRCRNASLWLRSNKNIRSVCLAVHRLLTVHHLVRVSVHLRVKFKVRVRDMVKLKFMDHG